MILTRFRYKTILVAVMAGVIFITGAAVVLVGYKIHKAALTRAVDLRTARGDGRVVRGPTAHRNEHRTVLAASRESEPLDKLLHESLATLVTAFAVIFGISILASLCLAHVLAAPISRIAVAAGRIAQGNLGRTRYSQSSMELARLSNGIDSMRKTINEKIVALEDKNARLVLEIVGHQESVAALDKSETKYRNLVENMAHLIFTTDAQGHITFMNTASKSVLGYDPVELVGCSYHNFIHQDDRDKVASRSRRIFKGQRGNFEFRAATKAGGTCYLQFNGYPLFQNGRFVGVQGIATNVTRTKELEEMVLAKDKMCSLGRVSAGIAHEVRNPLSSILVLLANIRENFENPEQAKNINLFLNQCELAAQKIELVIKRVLDFSRPGDPKFMLASAATPIRDALDLTATILRRQGIELQTDIDDHLPKIYMDSQLLAQVLLNLINNAIEAMRETTNKKILSVNARPNDQWVLIHVTDTGPGVRREIGPKIFDAFFTTKAEGSGIGLSICRRIVTDHGGSINVLPGQKNGATFVIKLPKDRRGMHREEI